MRSDILKERPTDRCYRNGAAMLQNLQKIGYDDVVSVEVFDPDIQSMPAESCIPLAYKKTVEAFRTAGVTE